MENEHAEKQNVIPLVRAFSHISVNDLDDIMEWLNDREYMSEKGHVFKTAFWTLFITSGT